jgi:hypothetical protein
VGLTRDYRSQIALASSYPKHVLFLANDNHTSTLKQDGNTGPDHFLLQLCKPQEMKELLKGIF